MRELIRPEFGVLQAEGDYIRIRVSLCLLCFRKRNGKRCFALACVCANVYV